MTKTLITDGLRMVAKSGDEVISGPPWLWLCVIPDESTTSLHALFQTWIDRLDEATGDAVHAAFIGNPSLSGKLYESMRSSSLAKLDAADAKKYMQSIKKLGGTNDAEIVHRIRGTRELAALFGLGYDDLPCVAFCTRPELNPPATLPIKREWLDTEHSRHQLMQIFANWFAHRRYESAIPHGATVGQVREMLLKLLPRLYSEIDGAARAESKSAMRKTRRKRTPIITLRLEGVENDLLSRACCARLVYLGKSKTPSWVVGVRQLFYLLAFFSWGHKRSIGGAMCVTISETDLTAQLREWHKKGIRTLSGADMRNASHRVQKEWGQFVRQMSCRRELESTFSFVRPSLSNKEKLYVMKLGKVRLQMQIHDLDCLLLRVSEIAG